MTLRFPKHHIGDAIPFDGTDGERAKNRLTHAWEQVPNPIKSMPIPKSWVEQLSREEALGLAKPPVDTLPKCSKCGCWGASEEANWECGVVPRFTETIW